MDLLCRKCDPSMHSAAILVQCAPPPRCIHDASTPWKFHGAVATRLSVSSHYVSQRFSTKLCAASDGRGIVGPCRATKENSVSQESICDGRDMTASDVVRRFYDAVNARDVDAAVELLSDDCVYEDLLYPTAFSGKEVWEGRYLNSILVLLQNPVSTSEQTLLHESKR